ncbi:hypothetical protein DFJ73DRAFT_135824 [Zopfochytrium polystomum]|nr:hypothetical protein DFJ73DRAFT_135824 [Zopfochytrium polystomum]
MLSEGARVKNTNFEALKQAGGAKALKSWMLPKGLVMVGATAGGVGGGVVGGGGARPAGGAAGAAAAGAGGAAGGGVAAAAAGEGAGLGAAAAAGDGADDPMAVDPTGAVSGKRKKGKKAAFGGVGGGVVPRSVGEFLDEEGKRVRIGREMSTQEMSRVTLRDALFSLENDRRMAKSAFYFKWLGKLR